MLTISEAWLDGCLINYFLLTEKGNHDKGIDMETWDRVRELRMNFKYASRRGGCKCSIDAIKVFEAEIRI